MLNVDYESVFLKKINKINDNSLKDKIKKQVGKIVEAPEVGKPMRYVRKGTRELYLKPFRIAYAYLKDENKIVFLDLYHKDLQ